MMKQRGPHQGRERHNLLSDTSELDNGSARRQGEDDADFRGPAGRLRGQPHPVVELKEDMGRHMPLRLSNQR